MARVAPIIVSLLFLSFPATASETVVRLVVEGIEPPTGIIHVAVFDRAEDFPKNDKKRLGLEFQAQAPIVDVRLPPLPMGRYAIAAFHDANSNGSFDQGLFGIPLESFGFSNGAKAYFSAPDFEEAAVSLNAAEIVVRISLDR